MGQNSDLLLLAAVGVAGYLAWQSGVFGGASSGGGSGSGTSGSAGRPQNGGTTAQDPSGSQTDLSWALSLVGPQEDSSEPENGGDTDPGCQTFEDVRRIFRRWTNFEITTAERDELLESCPEGVRTGIPKSASTTQASDKRSAVERARARFISGDITRDEFFDVVFDRKNGHTKTSEETLKEDFVEGRISQTEFFNRLHRLGAISSPQAPAVSAEKAKRAFESGEIGEERFFSMLNSAGHLR